MHYHTESKPQGWRALAVFEDGSECLVYVGRSTTQVRGGYASAFLELLDEDERTRVRDISLQRWNGAPDAGFWSAHTTLAVPSARKMAHTA
jgi:hypothetical protein